MSVFDIPEMTSELRRSSDGHAIRIAILEQQLGVLEQDVAEHRALSQRMCDILDGIRSDIAGAKGFAKAIVFSGTALALIIGALWTINWLKIPVPVF